jgi:hypothetical protein
VEALVTDSKGDTDHHIHQVRVTVKPSVSTSTLNPEKNIGFKQDRRCSFTCHTKSG